MGWASRTKHRGPGILQRRVKVTPHVLANLAGDAAGLEKILAGLPDEHLRAKVRAEVMPLLRPSPEEPVAQLHEHP